MDPKILVTYKGWFLSHVRPLWAGSGPAPCHFLSRNQVDKAASIWTPHSSLSNTVLAYVYVPE